MADRHSDRGDERAPERHLNGARPIHRTPVAGLTR
jgi:hypothetical protein